MIWGSEVLAKNPDHDVGILYDMIGVSTNHFLSCTNLLQDGQRHARSDGDDERVLREVLVDLLEHRGDDVGLHRQDDHVGARHNLTSSIPSSSIVKKQKKNQDVTIN